MAVKVIVELHARPGMRDRLEQFIDGLVAEQRPTGFLGSARYEVLDDPDVLVEIADWESAEARQTHMKESAATGVYAPLADMLAAPFRVRIISPLT